MDLYIINLNICINLCLLFFTFFILCLKRLFKTCFLLTHNTKYNHIARIATLYMKRGSQTSRG